MANKTKNKKINHDPTIHSNPTKKHPNPIPQEPHPQNRNSIYKTKTMIKNHQATEPKSNTLPITKTKKKAQQKNEEI